MITYTISDVPNKKATTNGLVDLTNEEKQTLVNKWNEYESKSAERKLKELRKIRTQKLIESDYLALSDVVLSDAWKDKRKSWRDIPQNFTTESQYDLLLARDSDGKLTHTIWESE